MRTAQSSSRHGGVGLDQIPLNFPLGCGPGPDPPQVPPWVWAWTRSPSTSPLGVGLDQIPLNFPLGVGLETPWGHAPPATRHTPETSHPVQDQPPPGTRHPPPCGQTHTCKHITLPQTSFAGGNY